MDLNKTQPTDTPIEAFLETVDVSKREDSRALIALMQKASGEKPVLWGSGIIGFGTYRYKYASGREGDWMRIGFSPRKAAFSLYLSCDVNQLADELAGLGTYTHGKGCIYIKRLSDISVPALQQMLTKAYQLTVKSQEKS